jgi:hypothetical protein
MYRLFDGAVACDFPLPGVPEVHGGAADITVGRGQGAAAEAGYDWLHSWREEDGELVLSCAHRCQQDGTSHYLLRFPDLADFVIAGNSVTCHPGAQCREDSLRHLLLDQVIPRLWAHRGHLVLHASAVQLPDGKVIACLGESGWGKSTLAAALQARGSRLVSDDSVCLRAVDDGIQLIPSYTGLRLNDDSIETLGLAGQGWTSVSHYSDKRRFEPVAEESSRSLLLDTLYIMEEPGPSTGSLSIRPLAGAELITTVIKRSFLLDTRDRQCARQQLQEASAVLRAAPRILSLAYPRDYRELPVLCDALLEEGRR